MGSRITERIGRLVLIAAFLGVPASIAIQQTTAERSLARSGPVFTLSRYSGPKYTVYRASYRYTTNDGEGCDIRVAIEWDGLSAGGGMTLEGGTGCKGTTGEMVAGNVPGRHQVCAVADVIVPSGLKIKTVCRTFTVTGAPKPTARPTPKPTKKPTPKPTAKPTPRQTASPTPIPTASPTPVATASPSAASKPTSAAVSSPSGAAVVPSPNPTASPIEGSPTSGMDPPIVGGIALVTIGAGVAIAFGLRRRRQTG